MRAGIGLGSNLGDRLQNLLTAVERVRRLSPQPDQVKISSIYETSPVDCHPKTSNFLNAAMEIETEDAPLTLLVKLQAIEALAGRPSVREKNTPRLLDLDLLYMDDLTLNDPELTLPHPFLTMRQFVLVPLSEISPGRILPNHTLPIQELLDRLKSDNSEIISNYS